MCRLRPSMTTWPQRHRVARAGHEPTQRWSSTVQTSRLPMSAPSPHDSTHSPRVSSPLRAASSRCSVSRYCCHGTTHRTARLPTRTSTMLATFHRRVRPPSPSHPHLHRPRCQRRQRPTRPEQRVILRSFRSRRAHHPHTRGIRHPICHHHHHQQGPQHDSTTCHPRHRRCHQCRRRHLRSHGRHPPDRTTPLRW